MHNCRNCRRLIPSGLAHFAWVKPDVSIGPACSEMCLARSIVKYLQDNPDSRVVFDLMRLSACGHCGARVSPPWESDEDGVTCPICGNLAMIDPEAQAGREPLEHE